MTDYLWALMYEHNGKLWSINHYGSYESALRHAKNLNTHEPEKVHLVIDSDIEDYRRSMN